MPLVSFVIASLNGRQQLPRAIESVLSQAYEDIELIVMDGGSKDGTVEYLQSLADQRLQWRSEKDGGLTFAWNKALRLAKGDWLLFLGADDFVWDNGVVARAAPYLIANSAALAFGEVRVVAEDSDQVVQSAVFSKPQLLAQLRGPEGLGLPHQGFFHNRKIFEAAPFDTSFRIAADYEVISRYALSDSDFLALPIGPVAAFRMGGLSTNPWVTLEVYREWKRIHRMRGRSAWHGWRQLGRAHMKDLFRRALGPRLARRLVNVSRRIRGLPLYSREK
jgi:glycosyltransferase involved in cell wall biosynthesis